MHHCYSMHAIQPAATCREEKRHFLSCDLHSACSGLRRQRACEYFISGEADAIAHTSELAFVKQASSGHVLVPVRSPPHPSTQRSKSPVVFRPRSFESHGEAASGASTLPGQLQTANWRLETGDSYSCCPPRHLVLQPLVLLQAHLIPAVLPNSQASTHANHHSTNSPTLWDSCAHAVQHDKPSRSCPSSMTKTNLRPKNLHSRRPCSSTLKEIDILEAP